VGEAGDGFELLEIARRLPADVYMVDISMPGLSGIEAAARLLKMRPGSRVVILTMYTERVLVDRAFQQGVHGYVLKDSSPEDIVRAGYGQWGFASGSADPQGTGGAAAAVRGENGKGNCEAA